MKLDGLSYKRVAARKSLNLSFPESRIMQSDDARTIFKKAQGDIKKLYSLDSQHAM